MHAALIIDEERQNHEQATLNRLAIGLIGEGVQVTRVVPDGPTSDAVERGEQRVALTARIPAPMRVLPWMRGDRAGHLAEAMEKNLPDVLYAVGEGAWGLGEDLAGILDRPLLIDLWSTAQIRRVPRGRAARSVAGYVAPTESIAEALGRRVEPALVFMVPMGVALPPSPHEVLAAPDVAIALAVVGGARDVPAYRALLGGLSRVIRERPQVQVFLELDGPNEHEVWRHARHLELLEHLTALYEASLQRSLLTRCDILLMPERYGELRSITLEAMMVGMPVVAADDPFLDMLVAGETAVIVERSSPNEWAKTLTRLLGDPEGARALGRAGHERVAAGHRSSDQIARLVEVFDHLVGGEAYPFAGSGSGPGQRR